MDLPKTVQACTVFVAGEKHGENQIYTAITVAKHTPGQKLQVTPDPYSEHIPWMSFTLCKRCGLLYQT